MEDVKISIVVPVFKGDIYLKRLTQEIQNFRTHLLELNCPITFSEAIFVDDNSIDDSNKLLKSLSIEYEWMNLVFLSRNFGQHPATMAGILHTSGDYVVTLDEDLQHHPKHILKLLKKLVLHEKDVIYANSDEHIHNSIYRDFTSRILKVIISKLSGNEHVKKFNSFRLIRGSIARATASVAIKHTYYDIALTWFTNRVDIVKIPLKDFRNNKEKSSGYSFIKLLSHSRRLVLSSNLKILRIISLLGLFAVLVAGLVGLYTIYSKLFLNLPDESSGWASIMISVLFLGGINAFIAGIILEYLSIILEQNHGKPTFFEIDRTTDEPLKEWFSEKELNKW